MAPTSPEHAETRRRRARSAGLLLLLFVALLLASCGSEDTSDDPGNAADAPDFSEMIATAPPELEPLYEGNGALEPGGIDAYREQIAALEGYPIVVNKWASWCDPCRAEFPHFQQQVAERGDEVAFLGINANDVDAAAETFLRDHPMPYVNFTDPDESLSVELGAAPAIPLTLFYNEQGEQTYMHAGPYESEADLAADIDKYAVDG